MSGFLEWLLGRLPVGWLQLVHNKARFASALAGVAFANILVFMQLGFFGALMGSVALPYQQMDADVLISSSDMNTLADAGPLPRQRLYEALAVNGVADATPLYYGKLDWKQSDGTIRGLDVFGIDPAKPAFRFLKGNPKVKVLTLADHALIDIGTRNVVGDVLARIERGEPYAFEAKGRTLSVDGVFRIGGGFTTDGYLIVSDQTFLRLFPQRFAGAPNHVLVKAQPGVAARDLAARLSVVLPAYDSQARPVDVATAREQAFQSTQRPVGMVFGFGIIIGTLVGSIIVYQVLATDVADHLKEYATFKAIGYRQGFFLGIVFEEAMVLAVAGFLPGVVISVLLYRLVAKATSLPLAMTLERPFIVLFGTLLMCGLSGLVATRRLARANPADLF